MGADESVGYASALPSMQPLYEAFLYGFKQASRIMALMPLHLPPCPQVDSPCHISVQPACLVTPFRLNMPFRGCDRAIPTFTVEHRGS